MIIVVILGRCQNIIHSNQHSGKDSWKKKKKTRDHLEFNFKSEAKKISINEK